MPRKPTCRQSRELSGAGPRFEVDVMAERPAPSPQPSHQVVPAVFVNVGGPEPWYGSCRSHLATALTTSECATATRARCRPRRPVMIQGGQAGVLGGGGRLGPRREPGAPRWMP